MSDRGFTFVEVLIVLVVLSFGVLGVLQTTLLAARIERASQAVTSGTFLAQERLERIGAFGWARATAGLSAGPLPVELGLDGAWLQEQIARPGWRFLAVYERDAAPVELPRCTVHCFWQGDGGRFDRRLAVHLSTRCRP